MTLLARAVLCCLLAVTGCGRKPAAVHHRRTEKTEKPISSFALPPLSELRYCRDSGALTWQPAPARISTYWTTAELVGYALYRYEVEGFIPHEAFILLPATTITWQTAPTDTAYRYVACARYRCNNQMVHGPLTSARLRWKIPLKKGPPT